MTDLQPPLRTLEDLVSFPSVSRTSNLAISEWIAERLKSRGFEVERSLYRDSGDVQKMNLLAVRRPRLGSGTGNDGGLAYFCHTDVVPADDWSGPGGNPFKAVATDERVYGRGACDMKGSLAAMLSAVEAADLSALKQPLWIVCTADEEVGFEGARHLVDQSSAYRELAESQPVSIIGEPTSLSVVYAHKGITGFRITSRGRAAHSGTADGINANVAMVPMLQTLLEIDRRTRAEARYRDERFDPPTLSWNFGVSDHCHAVNVTPARSDAWVSYRPMPGITGDDLRMQVRDRAAQLGLDFREISGGPPLWVDENAACVRELTALAGGTPQTVCYSTDGGTFADLEQRVVCGPGDIAQAHTTDEWLSLGQLAGGIDLYRRAIERWCLGSGG